MAYPFEHYYLQLTGSLGTGTGVEQFSIGFRTSSAFASDTQDGEQLALENLAVSVRAAWIATGCPVHGYCALRSLKYNRIGLDGRYMRNYTNVLDLASPAAGTKAGSVVYPPQVSLVGTLETGASRGLAHRGRVFIPQPGVAVSSDFKVSTTDTTAAATWLAGIVTAINTTEGPGDVVVASSGSKVPGRDPAGAQRTVTGVSIGNVLDTMRSRRQALTEARVEAAVTGQSGGGGGAF